MGLQPITQGPPWTVRWPLLTQRWEEVAFVHWAVAAEAVAPLLPAGTRPDTLDGSTYVGLVGFRMRGTGLSYGPPVPFFGTFCETNVRVYSVDDDGRRGVVFLSMDATRLLPVLTARAGLRLPYQWSAMRLGRDGDVLRYTCRRRWPDRPGTRGGMTVEAGDPITTPTDVEHFLTARWGLHTRAYGRTLYLPNAHPPWPLHRASLRALDDELIPAAGLPAPGGSPVSVLYSPGVPVRFGRPVAVG